MSGVPHRRFLFLQGPPGSFFRRLGERLCDAGVDVFRINLNGGDRDDWRDGTDYRGTAKDWPRFFDAFVRDHAVTDLVLFGDCRPLHHAARQLSRLRGIAIHVFEEGYLRPDWVTLEANGVNGNSGLSRDPAWYLATARDLPPVPALAPLAFSFRRRAREATRYYTQAVLQTWRFAGYRSHRHSPAIIEGIGWIRRFSGAGRARRRSHAALATIEGSAYFVLPLQLDSDHQVRVHSPFTDVRSALAFVTESFARAAPSDSLLLVKAHPLENGLTNWCRATMATARRFHVGDRVIFVSEGDIAGIVGAARGVVTINSTAGTFSLAASVPTLVLGEAVYDIAGITHQGPLDDFWQSPTAPDRGLWDAFCRVLVDRCLIRGGFSSDEGLDLLVGKSMQRLLRHG